jgi:hypothetical protein
MDVVEEGGGDGEKRVAGMRRNTRMADDMQLLRKRPKYHV